MQPFFITILCVWLSLCLYAQQTADSLQVVDIETITIKEAKALINSFSDNDTLTSNAISITNSLQQQSNFYVNTSSPNGLASLSLNGTAAKSIPVVWQNHNLNSIMNGIMDVQLLDNFLFNSIEIKYADSFEQAGWGGNAATVSVKDLVSSPIHIQHQLGSFGKQKIGLAYNWHHKKIQNNTKVFYMKAANDFPILQPQLNKEKQNNNAIKDWGILNNTAFTISKNHHFNINLWWQNTEREIASPLFTSNNNSTQVDSTFRLNLGWQYKPLNLKASVAYFNELNAYYNPQINIIGIHKTTAIKSYVTHHKKINKAFILSNSISYNWYQATSTNFEGKRFRKNVILKSILLYQLKNLPLKLKADVVVDFTDDKLLPIRPGVYAIYKLNSKFEIASQLSRHYSLPTFNDLYWSPGGNNELKPESGYLANLHFTYNNKNQLLKLSLFNSSINNEIVWLPGIAYWSPENVNKLQSKGFGLKAQQMFTITNKSKLNIIFNYNYLDAKDVNSNSESNLQLIYRPKHKASIGLTYYLAQHLQFNYSHQITSKRFTTVDNSNFVPAFNTTNISINYKIKIDKANLNIEATLLNAYNTYYEVTANRPMPGTHFLITTNLNF